MNVGKYDQVVSVLQETVWPSFAKMYVTLTTNGVPPEHAEKLVEAEMGRHFEASKPRTAGQIATLQRVNLEGFTGVFWLLSVEGDKAYVLEAYDGHVTDVPVSEVSSA